MSSKWRLPHPPLNTREHLHEARHRSVLTVETCPSPISMMRRMPSLPHDLFYKPTDFGSEPKSAIAKLPFDDRDRPKPTSPRPGTRGAAQRIL